LCSKDFKFHLSWDKNLKAEEKLSESEIFDLPLEIPGNECRPFINRELFLNSAVAAIFSIFLSIFPVLLSIIENNGRIFSSKRMKSV
jgi:hypothetical protein